MDITRNAAYWDGINCGIIVMQNVKRKVNGGCNICETFFYILRFSLSPFTFQPYCNFAKIFAKSFNRNSFIYLADVVTCKIKHRNMFATFYGILKMWATVPCI